MKIIYDGAHNIVKREEHEINRKRRRVWVHRKGTTRAFGSGRQEIPADYRSIGQPVFILGTMGTSSWVLVGKKKAMDLTFGSTPHGAGRVLSLSEAERRFWGGDVKDQIQKKGVAVRATSQVILAKEAYKDVDKVVNVSHNLGIGSKVVRLLPLAVVKG